MNRRTALVLGIALAAFALVVIGGLVSNATRTTTTTTTATAQRAPVEQAVPTQRAPVEQVAPTQRTPAEQAAPPQLTPAPGSAVSAAQAGQVALQAAPGAVLQGTPQLVTYQGVTAYEVVLDQGKIYVDAQSGQVIASSIPTTGNAGDTGGGTGGGEGGEEGEEEEDDD